MNSGSSQAFSPALGLEGDEGDCAMQTQPSTTVHPKAATRIAGTRPKRRSLASRDRPVLLT